MLSSGGYLVLFELPGCIHAAIRCQCVIVVYGAVDTRCDVPIDQDYIRSLWVVVSKLMQFNDAVPVPEFMLSAVELAVTLEIPDDSEWFVLLSALPN